jgi:hypothetical protein
LRGAAAVIAAVLWLTPAPAAADINLWPLLQTSEDETTILYPLHVREPGLSMNVPFYHHAEASGDTHILWPLIKIHDGKLDRVAPFYFSPNDDFLLFPFIYQTQDFTLWFIPPSYFDDETSAVIPFYIKSPNTMFVFPNFYQHRDSTTGMVDHWSCWPLASWKEIEGGTRSHFLLYWSQQKRDQKTSLLFPFYYSNEKPNAETQWLFPLYFNSDETNTVSGTVTKKRGYLWPLYSLSEVRNKSGEVKRRDRRFLIFSDTREQSRRTLRLFGWAIYERL